MNRVNFFGTRVGQILTLVAISSAVCATSAWAQNPNNNMFLNNGMGVGGVSINAEGALQNATTDELGRLSRQRGEVLEKIPADLATGAALRKVSLRGIEAALVESTKDGKPLPVAVQCLGGLQRIEYVFVYPEKQDIVLVGPGEGWRVDGRGNVVGAKSGRSVLLLDDLLTALRSAKAASQGGISCSIDPTKAGLNRLNNHVSTLKTIGRPEETAAGIENALGPQQISITGVPGESHFASVIVAADYRMKRIAMGFEPSPVKGIPSFLTLVPASGHGMNNMLPRWWLEPQYDAILRDADGLAWQLRGSSVKTMTEEDFLTANGDREHTGKASLAAQRWADALTAKYAELAVAEPIFGELQNCMDLAIVSALIVKERLLDKAGHSMPALFDDAGVKTVAFAVPKTVASKASLLKKNRGWVITASGGVMIDSWGIAGKAAQDEAPAKARASASAGQNASWCWN